jgi:Tol biopolymer transport system component
MTTPAVYSARMSWPRVPLRPLALLAVLGASCGGARLPSDLSGTLLFVSNRDGRDTIYLRRLPDGADFALVVQDEPVGEPAISPNGKEAAFSMRGRIGLVTLETHAVRFLTLGVDWKDGEPSWRPDGRALVVSSRHLEGAAADVHLLLLSPPAGGDLRQPLTRTEHLDENHPAFTPDGRHVAFIRGDNLFRVEVSSGHVQRLTGGFRLMRYPRFLPSGRLLCLWTQGKQFGLDAMDADGENRETLSQGTAFYRTLAPSPDGKYLAVTLGFETDALRFRQSEEVRLLDERGQPVGTLAESFRTGTHSPSWGR